MGNQAGSPGMALPVGSNDVNITVGVQLVPDAIELLENMRKSDDDLIHLAVETMNTLDDEEMKFELIKKLLDFKLKSNRNIKEAIAECFMKIPNLDPEATIKYKAIKYKC